MKQKNVIPGIGTMFRIGIIKGIFVPFINKVKA